MNNVIIGTAGHVDHGKTCLIKALTGIDTDRLKEEKKRGITIELGFAHLDFEDGRKVGIIDVPGHEKFVKNMLAGAGGIDIALLIVAANEGVMPQTREHLAILKLLGIRCGVIAVTKSDTVDRDWMEMVKEDIGEMVSGTFLEDAKMIETSVFAGEGIGLLKEELKRLVDGAGAKALDMPFRIPVDRVFSVDGFGTVITGTLVDGAIKKGDVVQIFPKGGQAKVRNIQVHDTDVEEAYAGQRVAVNLAGVKKEELSRGVVLGMPGSMEKTYILDVRLDAVKDTSRSIKNGSRLHFYHGSRDILCKVVLLDREELKPGESCYAQLRLEEEAAVKYRDKYIVRFYSPLETVGGGTVLKPNAKKQQRNKPAVIESLQVMENGSGEAVVEEVVHDYSAGYPELCRIRMAANMSRDDFDLAIASLSAQEKIILLGNGTVMGSRHYNSIKVKSAQILKEFHQKNQFKKGMNSEEYKSRLLLGILENAALTGAVLEKLVLDQAVIIEAGLVRDPGFKVEFAQDHMKVSGEIEKVYQDAGFIVPAKDDVLAAIKGKNTSKIMDSMISDGILVMVDKQMLFHRDYYQKAIEIVKSHIELNGQITLGEFRDAIGASRKYAVALLEHFDSKKLTKKVGDLRVLQSSKQ